MDESFGQALIFSSRSEKLHPTITDWWKQFLSSSLSLTQTPVFIVETHYVNVSVLNTHTMLLDIFKTFMLLLRLVQP